MFTVYPIWSMIYEWISAKRVDAKIQAKAQFQENTLNAMTKWETHTGRPFANLNENRSMNISITKLHRIYNWKKLIKTIKMEWGFSSSNSNLFNNFVSQIVIHIPYVSTAYWLIDYQFYHFQLTLWNCFVQLFPF